VFGIEGTPVKRESGGDLYLFHAFLFVIVVFQSTSTEVFNKISGYIELIVGYMV